MHWKYDDTKPFDASDVEWLLMLGFNKDEAGLYYIGADSEDSQDRDVPVELIYEPETNTWYYDAGRSVILPRMKTRGEVRRLMLALKCEHESSESFISTV